MRTIQPIGQRQQRRVTAATERCIARANVLLEACVANIPVYFDLSGRTAGQYRTARGRRVIRYNPYLFAKYFNENVATTVPHEVAHYLIDAIYGQRNVKPHGNEWRNMMQLLGAEASVRADFDLAGIPTRRYRRIPYECRCRVHQLTRIRHTRVQGKSSRYFCRVCGTELVPAADS